MSAFTPSTVSIWVTLRVFQPNITHPLKCLVFILEISKIPTYFPFFFLCIKKMYVHCVLFAFLHSSLFPKEIVCPCIPFPHTQLPFFCFPNILSPSSFHPRSYNSFIMLLSLIFTDLSFLSPQHCSSPKVSFVLISLLPSPPQAYFIYSLKTIAPLIFPLFFLFCASISFLLHLINQSLLFFWKDSYKMEIFDSLRRVTSQKNLQNLGTCLKGGGGVGPKPQLNFFLSWEWEAS